MANPGREASERLPIHSVAVIGAGERGRSFALRSAAAGLDVVLQDVVCSRLRKVQEQMTAEPEGVQRQLRLAESIEDAVRQADIVIDFVPDELESKLEIFSLLDRMAPPKTILCTPTQLSITDLASCTYRGERCVALAGIEERFATQVELLGGEKTDSAVLRAVEGWLVGIGFMVRLRAEGDRLLQAHF